MNENIKQQKQHFQLGLGTRAVWAGEDNVHWERATQLPVVHSVSFGYCDLDEWLAVAQGKAKGHVCNDSLCMPPETLKLETGIQGRICDGVSETVAVN